MCVLGERSWLSVFPLVALHDLIAARCVGLWTFPTGNSVGCQCRSTRMADLSERSEGRLSPRRLSLGERRLLGGSSREPATCRAWRASGAGSASRGSGRAHSRMAGRRERPSSWPVVEVVAHRGRLHRRCRRTARRCVRAMRVVATHVTTASRSVWPAPASTAGAAGASGPWTPRQRRAVHDHEDGATKAPRHQCRGRPNPSTLRAVSSLR